MSGRKQPSAKICEESIIELHAQTKQFSERVLHLLDSKKPPEAAQRAIAVTIDGKRARAYLNSVSCSFDDRIVCQATATPEDSPDTRHLLDLTFKNGCWKISIERSFAFVDGEDIGALIH